MKLYRCPTHGLLTEETIQHFVVEGLGETVETYTAAGGEGCPIPTYHEQPCEQPLTAAGELGEGRDVSEILRVYDPVECDERGWPLDYERCRTCGGARVVHTDRPGATSPRPCPACDSHGSLKAAALSHVGMWNMDDDGVVRLRCEGCGHQISEGTWEDRPHRQPDHEIALDYALRCLRNRQEPMLTVDGVHYSSCDEGCRHGGPGRHRPSDRTHWVDLDGRVVAGLFNELALSGSQVEASWRQVDVRTLGWPHDLRPEKLAVLCLRCYTERSAT